MLVLKANFKLNIAQLKVHARQNFLNNNNANLECRLNRQRTVTRNEFLFKLLSDILDSGENKTRFFVKSESFAPNTMFPPFPSFFKPASFGEGLYFIIISFPGMGHGPSSELQRVCMCAHINAD